MRRRVLVASFVVLAMIVTRHLVADDRATVVRTLAGTWRVESYKEHYHYDALGDAHDTAVANPARGGIYESGRTWVLREDSSATCGDTSAKWSYDSRRQTFSLQTPNFLGIMFTRVNDARVMRDHSKVIIKFNGEYNKVCVWTLVPVDPPAESAPVVAETPKPSAGKESSTETASATQKKDPFKRLLGTWKERSSPVGITKSVIKVYRSADGTVSGTFYPREPVFMQTGGLYWENLENFKVDPNHEDVITCDHTSSVAGFLKNTTPCKIEFVEPGSSGPQFHFTEGSSPKATPWEYVKQ
jgi:hypothetical protein